MKVFLSWSGIAASKLLRLCAVGFLCLFTMPKFGFQIEILEQENAGRNTSEEAS